MYSINLTSKVFFSGWRIAGTGNWGSGYMENQKGDTFRSDLFDNGRNMNRRILEEKWEEYGYRS